MEIERKFLVPAVPSEIELVGGIEYEQTYLCIEPVVRIRREGEEYWMTYKSKGLMIREEYNLPLTRDSFLHLLEKADYPLLKKTRYFLPYEGYTIELDIFHGKLAPLMIAEVEFPDEAACHSFVPPAWFGSEVTEDPLYHNVSLIRRTFADLPISGR